MLQDYMDRLADWSGDFLEGPYFWAVLLGVLLILVLWLYSQCRTLTFVAFDNESGSVRVSQQAINEIIQKASHSMDAVSKSSTHLKSRKGLLDIEVRIRLAAGARLSDVSSQLQSRLNQTLRNNLGIERLGKINILVAGISGTPPAETFEPPAEEALFPPEENKTSPEGEG